MNSIPQIPQDQVEKIRKAVLDKSVMFCFIPFPSLRDSIAKGLDEDLNALPQNMKELFLTMPNGAGIAISNSIVMNYIEGKCDQRNKKLLDQGEIKILSDGMQIVG